MFRLPLTMCLSVMAVVSVAAGDTGTSSVDPNLTEDMKIIRQRLLDVLIADDQRHAEQARKYMESLKPDGSWPDVDYVHRSRTSWRTFAHISRVHVLAAAYRSPGHALSGEPGLKTAFLSAFKFWVDQDFRSPNWWWNAIAVPRTMGPILLLMSEQIPEDPLRKGSQILGRADPSGESGQNLVWLTETAIVRGCVERNPDTVAKAFGRIAEEISITANDGIQADFSFHQHGAQLYSGGYGFAFSVDCSRLAVLAHGTAFAFPQEKIDILSSYMLDGQQRMMRNTTFDHASMGREIVRGNYNRSPALLTACRDLMKLKTPRSAELAAFAARLSGKVHDSNYLHCHHHFWRSDFSVHHRQGYYTSVKMSSRRIGGWEIVNQEGLRSHNTADGMNLLYMTGDEYKDIFPVWDWQRIPGTTCQQLRKPFGKSSSMGSTTFVGGVSDGEYGVTAIDFEKKELRGRNAWFFFDSEYVCLGSGIRCSSEHPVLTSINQCHLKGNVVVADEGGQRTLARAEHSLADVRLVHHDGVGYVFPTQPGARARVKNEVQTGQWKDISATASGELVSHDVFSLWVEHGVSPKEDTYAYIVAPGVLPGDMATYASGLPIEIMANRPDLQVVGHRGLRVVGMAFYKPGTADLARGLTVDVDQPCLVLLREREQSLQLAVSNPKNEALTVVIEVTARLSQEGAQWIANRGVSRVTFDLPGGSEAGKSIVRQFVSAND